MKRIVLLLLTIVFVVVGVVMLIPHNVKAATDGDYTYIVTDGKAEIVFVDKSIRGDITIPSTLGGYSVASIANSVFENRTNLTSVVIPDSITSIGNWAFSGCTSLTSVELGDGVTSIGNGAFDNCTSIANVEIGDNVTSISGAAFRGCTSLTNVVIPDSVTKIESSTFENCTNLVSITIPNSVTVIKSFAFSRCTSLTSVVIPNSVTTIGGSAFNLCEGLTIVEIGDSVTTIENAAFYYCTSLISIDIGASVTSIGYIAFDGCDALKNVSYNGTEEAWNKITIASNNPPLLNASIMYLKKGPIEEAVEGTELTIGIIGEKTVIIVPTVSGNVAMTESELAEMLGDDITIVSNNGIIGTGSKIIVGEQEVEIAVKGDIDGDGVATVFDALMVKKALAENSFSENDIREFAGDIDGEGVTNSEDIDAILAHIVGEMLIV